MAQVSIIVPVYNVPAKLLRQCIESCLGQTLRDIEVIAVDDGSTDGCGKILDEYAAKDARLKVIHKTNGGLVSARNAGYEEVSAPWHMYLDGDDFIDLDTCEKLMKAVEDNPGAEIFFWNYLQHSGDNVSASKNRWTSDSYYAIYTDAQCSDLARNTLVYTSGISMAWCKLVNTEFAKLHGLSHKENLRQGAEGIEYSLRAFSNCKKAVFINENFNHYIYLPTSISKSINEKNTRYLAESFDEIKSVIGELAEKEVFEATMYERLQYVLISMALNIYFNPLNKLCFTTRKRRFVMALSDYPIFSETLRHPASAGLGHARKITFFAIKHKLYFLLELIARAKHFMLKRGKFSY